MMNTAFLQLIICHHIRKLVFNKSCRFDVSKLGEKAERPYSNMAEHIDISLVRWLVVARRLPCQSYQTTVAADSASSHLPLLCCRVITNSTSYLDIKWNHISSPEFLLTTSSFLKPEWKVSIHISIVVTYNILLVRNIVFDLVVVQSV